MDEFDGGRQVMVTRIIAAAQTRGGDAEQRPQAFAAGSDQVRCQGRNDGHVGLHAICDCRVDLRHVRFAQTDQGTDICLGRLRVACLRGGCAHSVDIGRIQCVNS